MKKAKQQGLGAGYLLKLTILISLLMICNSHLVGQVVQANVTMLPDFLNDVRLYQFFQIFVPIVLLCLQFWVYDRFKDRTLTRMESGSPSGS